MLLVVLTVVVQAGVWLECWPAWGAPGAIADLGWPLSAIVLALVAGLAYGGELVAARAALRGVKHHLEDSQENHIHDLETANQALHQRVADLEQANRDLTASQAAAESACHAKSQFLANMSHEIRTPMNAILGYADLLNEPYLAETDHSRAVKTIRRNGDHLIQIVTDIVDLSKIEAGQLTLDRIPTAPQDVVAQVASLMRAEAGNKGLLLEVEYRGLIPRTIQTDPRRLRQVLINLVSNAIKFTDAGKVRIVVTMATEDDVENPLICFDVVDTGIGMTRAQQVRAFDAFANTDPATTRQFGGTGLGLAIAKRLAQLLGGDIIVRSALDMGSTFSLTAATGPLEGVEMIRDPKEIQLDTLDPDPSDSPPLRLSGRVLLAEDGRDNQWLISYLLRHAGAMVTVVIDGQSACDEAIKAHENGNPFDVILMDMQMPVLDGFGATTKLRTRGYAHPIIALTAHAMKGDRERCLSAGCDDYIAKPTDKTTLLRTVARYLSNRPDPVTAN